MTHSNTVMALECESSYGAIVFDHLAADRAGLTGGQVTFALILRRLVAQGVTILMVSHDVPFCAEYAHKCGLFFDGSVVAEGTPREFFSGNSFYTTPANRMARHLIPQVVAAVLIVLCIPLTIFAGVMYLGNQHYSVTAMLVLMECMVPFFLVFESRKPKARELVTIAVLCAIGIAGRSAFFMLPQFKPVLALVIISGVAFGGETGFLVGAVTMLVSNVLFSQGPWMPWQMFSMGIIGFLAGVLFRKGLLRRSRGSLATFGAFAAVIIYGGIMNPAAALMYNSQTLNWEMLKAYYVSGLPMDLIHAAATVIFIMIAAEPMLEKLDRIKVKYGLVE